MTPNAPARASRGLLLRAGGAFWPGGSMTERPILFSGPMVRAILDGRKVETRRAIKPQPTFASEAVGFEFVGWLDEYMTWRTSTGAITHGECLRCPYGQPGDLLYVREAFAYLSDYQGGDPGTRALADGCLYRTDYPGGIHLLDRWRPSIHMPKRFARIWLRVEEVRVERVQEIDDEAALREGVEGHPVDGHAGYPIGFAPRDEFADLWDSINAKRGFGWDVNPWVWVVRFSVASVSGRADVREAA